MSRYRPTRPQPKQPMTVAQSVVNLTMLLVGCSDEALASFTPQHLAASYRVSPLMADEMLRKQRQHRASRA